MMMYGPLAASCADLDGAVCQAREVFDFGQDVHTLAAWFRPSAVAGLIQQGAQADDNLLQFACPVPCSPIISATMASVLLTR